MLSGAWAAAAPYVCGAALVSTTAFGLVSGWLIETTPTTMAARATLVWIAVMWPLWHEADRIERPWMCAIGAVIIGGLTTAIGVCGIAPTLAVCVLAAIALAFVS